MTEAGERYDEIGRSYAVTRQEDSRIADAIHSSLGPAHSLLNIGAGSGNYEPAGMDVVAVEPSPTMIDQRRSRSHRVIRAEAERLPLADQSFDVSLAILTVHHWSDPVAGLREMMRVARRQVVFYFEALHTHQFWGLEYFPSAMALPTEIEPPGEGLYRSHLNVREIRKVMVPADCRDGFGTAYWARPEAYLDPKVQAGMSWLAMLSEGDRRQGSQRLKADLDSGEWDRRFGHLRDQATFDGGYRIAIAY